MINSNCFCGTGPYTRSDNPVWSFVDLTGNQFDDTFYMWVLSNQIPYVPSAIYQTPTGTPWTDPIQFLANGTLPNNLYWDPNVIYRLEFRQNLGLLPPSQNDPLIYLVENYAPNGNNSEEVVTGNSQTGNQITNPQFVDVNFDRTLTLSNLTNPAPIEIAPGWFLVLTGTGNVTMTQVALNDTTSNPTNAPYALQLTFSGGWTSNPILRQRFQQNGMLWANKYVSVSFTGLIQGSSQIVTSRLQASNGAFLAILANSTLTNTFEEYTGVALLPQTLNPNTPPAAYIDFQIVLPSVGDVFLTSFQLLASEVDTTYEYIQDTVDRQLDYLFHYYNPKLQYEPIPSYLVGWDFPFNPTQFLGPTIAAGSQTSSANASFYAWDQTIVFQSAASGVSVSRGTSGALTLTAAQSTQTAIIQYLEAPIANKILNSRLAVNISAAASNANGLVASVGLWYTKTSLPNVATGTNNSIVATLDANGNVLTKNGTWFEVPRTNLGNAQFTIGTSATTQYNDYTFNGWDMQGVSDVNSATFFAIVVGTASMTMNDTVTFNSVSLQAGDIATRPAPQSPSEVVFDCNRYYWMTFSPGTVPAQNVGVTTGEACAIATTNSSNYFPSVYFPSQMYTAPNITFYNPAAANAFIRDESAGSNYVSTTTRSITQNSVVFVGGNGGSGVTGNLLGVHITADARLGIV